MTVTIGWGLAVALVLLTAVAVLASLWGKTGLGKAQVIAAIRAIVQLAAVSLVIAAAVPTLWGAFAFGKVDGGMSLITRLVVPPSPLIWNVTSPSRIRPFASGKTPYEASVNTENWA